jgi:Na+-translocating ferredoxin:NAD+ oxidoreductase RNF subunit RnfB
MSSTIIITIITLTLLGLLSAVILFLVASKFKVFEDPRIEEVLSVLPAVNCGGCGFPGCRNFSEALVKAPTLDGLNCPVGGNPVMKQVAGILGKEVVQTDLLVAVVRCNGTPRHRRRSSVYNGPSDCRLSHNLYIGETDCAFGCMGLGDCARACTFGAMYIDPETQLPVVIDEKCVSCGLCVKACPRQIIELRKKAKKDRKIYVSCVNTDMEGPARRACNVACIGCGKCVEVCKFDAITLSGNLAWIDSFACTFCRKCVSVCPTTSILEINFPVPKPKQASMDTATS